MMKEKRINVLVIIPNLSPGGAQNVFRQQYDYLTTRYQVHGCVFNWDGTSPEQWPSSIVSLDVLAGSTIVSKAISFVARIWKLRKLKKKLGIEVSISHLEGADYINILSGSFDKKLLWIHGTKQYDGNIKGLLGWLRKAILIPKLYKRANKIVTVSNGIALELERNYALPRQLLCTIYNGLSLTQLQELAHHQPAHDYAWLCQKYTVVITHCRLAAQKNISGFIQVAHRLKDLSAVKWVIVGDGEERNLLLQLCKKLDIPHYNGWLNEPWSDERQIYFLGFQSNPFAYLKQAHLFILTSLWEGFPLALCEAMACALPVLASDCFTGPREILAPELPPDLPTIEKPKRELYGILLPLLQDRNEGIITMWAEEIKKTVQAADTLKHYSRQSTERVRAFTSDISLQKVSEVIGTI